MRKVQIAAALLLFSLGLEGCATMVAIMHPGAEGRFQVKGHIVTDDPSTSQKCAIKLYQAHKEEFITARDVEKQFVIGFGVAPAKARYFVDVTCEGAAHTFRSPVFTYGKEVWGPTPLDLGEIDLRSHTVDKGSELNNKSQSRVSPFLFRASIPPRINAV